MADLARVATTWQNFPGAPGVTTMFFENTDLQTKVDAVRTFFDAIKGMIPQGTLLTVPGVGDVINDADGDLVAAWSVTTAPSTVNGGGVGAFSGPSGAMVHWLTGAFLDGRRVRGRSFIVPIITTQYESNGTLSAVAVTTLQNAANALLTAVGGGMRVWHRPKEAVGDDPGHIGGSATVTSARVPDLAVVLRSRRI